MPSSPSLSSLSLPPASLNVAGGISAAVPNKQAGKLASSEKAVIRFLHTEDSFLLWSKSALPGKLEIGIRARCLTFNKAAWVLGILGFWNIALQRNAMEACILHEGTC